MTSQSPDVTRVPDRTATTINYTLWFLPGYHTPVHHNYLQFGAPGWQSASPYAHPNPSNASQRTQHLAAQT